MKRPTTLEELEDLGKPIMVRFTVDTSVLTEVICGNKPDMCKSCQLQFQCLSQHPLVLTWSEIEQIVPIHSRTLEASVRNYLNLMLFKKVE